MPCDYSQYPKNWKSEIRPRILKRAQNKCEWCGVPNYETIIRYDTRFRILHGLETEAAMVDGERSVKIILTIAHIDHDIANNNDSNLAALCQRCHLRHDRHQHAETRSAKKESTRLRNEPMIPGLEPSRTTRKKFRVLPHSPSDVSASETVTRGDRLACFPHESTAKRGVK